MYSYILNNWEGDTYNSENRMIHVQKHMRDDLTKDIHGVFQIDFKEILNIAIKNKGKKQIGYMCDIYCINVPGCGYEGGKNGAGHTLNYITLVTLPNSRTLITMFPSDELIIDKEKESVQGETTVQEEPNAK